MAYKVYPYKPSLKEGQDLAIIASEIQAVIEKAELNGWRFVQMQEVSVKVSENKGCFDFGCFSKPLSSADTPMTLLVFERVENA